MPLPDRASTWGAERWSGDCEWETMAFKRIEYMHRVLAAEHSPMVQVLHLAFKKDDGTLVGCMSSTFQPPWTERGCGHWGLLAVHPQHQVRLM